MGYGEVNRRFCRSWGIYGGREKVGSIRVWGIGYRYLLFEDDVGVLLRLVILFVSVFMCCGLYSLEYCVLLWWEIFGGRWCVSEYEYFFYSVSLVGIVLFVVL